MAVQGLYLGWRIRHTILPFIRTFGQWVDEHVIPLSTPLNAKAEAFKQEVYQELMSRPVPEDYSGDAAEIAEYAFDKGLSFYEQITAMYQATLNLFSAGLFHAIEQQLADLTRDGAIACEVSDTKLEVVTKWYRRHFNVDLEQFPSWGVINELRLVANTTKHAEGGSADELRIMRPDLFQNPLIRTVDPGTPMLHTTLSLPLGGDGLYVTADDFRAYAKAATELFDWLVVQFERSGEQYFPK